MSALESALSKKRAVNSAKQERYLEKVRSVDALEKRAQELRKEIRIRLTGRGKSADWIDVRLMERNKPVRAQPSDSLGAKERTQFVRCARIKFKRAMYDWLLAEIERLETTLDQIKSARLVKVVTFAEDDWDDIDQLLAVLEKETESSHSDEVSEPHE